MHYEEIQGKHDPENFNYFHISCISWVHIASEYL